MGLFSDKPVRHGSKSLVKNKRRLYSLLECIQEDYISLTEIDLDNDSFDMFMINPVFETLGVPRKGKFTEAFRQAAEKYVSSENLENVSKVFDSEYIRQTLATRKSFEFEFELMWQSLGWQKITFSVMERDQGIPVKVLMTQVTVDKGRKEQLRQQKAILEAYNYAEAANAAKTNFLSHMSHDMRTPMNGIIGMTSIAKANIGNEDKVLDCLKKIDTASNQLLDLINEVLDLSRIESGKEELREDEIIMGDFIESIISIVRPQAGQKGQTLNVAAQKVANEELVGDKHKLSQILINLLSNAIKYTQEGGTITLTIEERDTNDPGFTEYILKVEDNGIGMTEEFQKTLFDPFTRAKDLRVENTVGSGLGRSITKNLVRMLHGTITVYSRLNEGSRFEVRIPLKLSGRSANANITLFRGKSAILICNHEDRTNVECTADGTCIK
ncbi:MAG: HAMP domain-containing histidine kinase, partial [Lachnospiraceae bacterium]|nr:HAMP domain-containing histidine kinase [Lachnospiraceae bacterium]